MVDLQAVRLSSASHRDQYLADVGSDKIVLTGSWTNLVGKVILSIVTFDQLGGPDSRLADWPGRLRQSCYRDQ